jgi:hemolysin activation/secretion protein
MKLSKINVSSAFFCIASSFHAAAQIGSSKEFDIGARNQQEFLRQQQQELQLRQQQERTPDVRLVSPQATVADTLPVETPCFVIERLSLQDTSGAPLPAFDWVIDQLSAAKAPVFLGQCIGAQGVAWVMDRAQQALIARGYVTSRVLVTQQDMSHGALVLTLIPGRIRAIRLTDPIDPRVNLKNALPMQAGDVLNLRDIEQGLENLKRVPTADADIQITPAEGEGAQIGESDLLMSYSQVFPLRLTVSADDSGTKATGKYQGSLTVSFDNALALNDLFYITNTNSMGGGDSGPRGTHAHIVHYSVPQGYWTISATSSSSKYFQTVVGLNQSYVYRGTSQNNEIKLNRLLMRDHNQKLNWAVRAFQRKSNNYIDDTEVNVQQRVVGGWDSTLNHKAFIQAATLESNFTYKRGTGAFGSIVAPEEAFNEGTSKFALVTADVNLTWPLTCNEQRIRYNGTWRAQHNRTPLTPQDRFAIGGRYTVRGFDGESVLSAERGWVWRNDLSFALADGGQEIYAGLDTGQVGGPTTELLVGSRLTGAVVGLRGAIHKLNYDIFIATPVHKPDNFKTSGSTTGFSLSMSF